MEKFNAMRTRLLQHLQKKAIRSRSIMTLVCLLLASASAFAQTKTVTGTVTDAANEPLIGASVLVQGTSTGTITDMDGKYSISVTPEDVLAFSYVGMTSQTIKVGTQNVINVTLKEDSQVLAETVVIGYGSAKKRDLTGSITNIKGEELANKPAMNPLSSLQGKVAGVQIVNSGRAGSDPEIRIRGTNSINGYKPLYIVDGLFNDNINFLNPVYFIPKKLNPNRTVTCRCRKNLNYITTHTKCATMKIHIIPRVLYINQTPNHLIPILFHARS